MHQIIVKYKNGKDEIFIEHDYDKACALCSQLFDDETVSSTHLKAVM